MVTFMSKKKIFFGSNLKMYKTVSETVNYLSELQQITHDLDRKDLTLFIIPSYTSLYTTKNIVDRELISIGSQNVCWEEKGQFTGEISPIMLQECDVNVVWSAILKDDMFLVKMITLSTKKY